MDHLNSERESEEPISCAEPWVHKVGHSRNGVRNAYNNAAVAAAAKSNSSSSNLNHAVALYRSSSLKQASMSCLVTVVGDEGLVEDVDGGRRCSRDGHRRLISVAIPMPFER